MSLVYRLTAHVGGVTSAADERISVKVCLDAPPNEYCYFLLNRPARDAEKFHVGQAIAIDLDFGHSAAGREEGK